MVYICCVGFASLNVVCDELNECVGGVGGVGGLGSWRVGWRYVCVRCEPGFFVLMAGPGICILC